MEIPELSIDIHHRIIEHFHNDIGMLFKYAFVSRKNWEYVRTSRRYYSEVWLTRLDGGVTLVNPNGRFETVFNRTLTLLLEGAKVSTLILNIPSAVTPPAFNAEEVQLNWLQFWSAEELQRFKPAHKFRRISISCDSRPPSKDIVDFCRDTAEALVLRGAPQNSEQVKSCQKFQNTRIFVENGTGRCWQRQLMSKFLEEWMNGEREIEEISAYNQEMGPEQWNLSKYQVEQIDDDTVRVRRADGKTLRVITSKTKPALCSE
ncbi:unnamed protein product, partial [Mesorhabditis spiculigera]